MVYLLGNFIYCIMAHSRNPRIASFVSRKPMVNSWYFNVAFALYILYKSWTLSGGATTPFIQSYLADFLALPVLLSVTIDLISGIKKGEQSLSLFQIIFAVLYISFFMEYFAPRWSEYAVSDWRDCIAYSLGGISFYLAQRVIKAT